MTLDPENNMSRSYPLWTRTGPFKDLDVCDVPSRAPRFKGKAGDLLAFLDEKRSRERGGGLEKAGRADDMKFLSKRAHGSSRSCDHLHGTLSEAHMICAGLRTPLLTAF